MTSDHLSTTFAALADPTRRAILARLALGEVSVMELAEPFAMSLPAVSKRLKVLENAGLITRGREAQWRPYRLEAGPLKDAADVSVHRVNNSSIASQPSVSGQREGGSVPVYSA